MIQKYKNLKKLEESIPDKSSQLVNNHLINKIIEKEKKIDEFDLITKQFVNENFPYDIVNKNIRPNNIVLIDDICDTAGTLTKSAGMLKERGALSVTAFCTHPVLSGKAYENIENSVLEKLVVCDTIPLKQACSKIEVLPTADLFAIAIRNTFENKSISSLFLHSKRKG